MNPNDEHIYPLKDLDEHFVEGAGCKCEPRVEVVGDHLLYIHNSFDHREIVEMAIDIMNGGDGEPI